LSVGFIVLLILFTWISPSFAADVVLAPPVERSVTGERMVIPVYYINSEVESVTISPPAQTICRWSSQGTTLEIDAVQLEAPINGTIEVAAGAQYKVLFAIDVPLKSGPRAILSLPQLSRSSIALTIDGIDPSFKESWEAQEDQHPSAVDVSDLSSIINAYQTYARKISFYQPIYFAAGVEPEESKFQFSFKYRIIDPEADIASRHPWLSGIYFAFTQTSFWDLDSDSVPFQDTSYKPELFFITENIDSGFALLDGFFIKTGVQHESNGRAGDDSRSTNITYLEPSMVFINEHNLSGLKISPRFWFYMHNEGTNRDLPEYRGYFDLGIAIGQAQSLIVDSHFSWAEQGGSVQIDLTYPMHRLVGKNLDFFLHIQYVSALAESLLNYDERTDALRIGFAFIR
jgi:outer membrane phospholipase A